MTPRPARRLWTGDWWADSEAARQQAGRARPVAPEVEEETTAEQRQPAPQPVTRTRPTAPRHEAGAERRPPRRRGPLVALAALVVALGVGGYALGTNSNDKTTASHSSAPAALPASTGAPIKPNTKQTQAGAIYARAAPAVVSIRTGSGSGTGFLIDTKGTLVTNAHVVAGADQVTVRFGDTGRQLSGSVLGVDASSDLAVVHVASSGIPSNAKPLGLADSAGVRVGDSVVAVGNPFGLDRTATAGIVSGLGREINAPNGFQIGDAIQTDAPINPGNSGGPLLDVTGRVIGVNSQIETAGGATGSVGIGFAVPSNTVRQVVPSLERGETVQHPWLGVETHSLVSGSGAQVATVVAGSPARDKLQTNDIITQVDGRKVTDPSSLASLIGTHQAGDVVHLQITRGGSSQSLDVTLGVRPDKIP